MGSVTPWLAVIAIATSVQALIFLGAAIVGFRIYRQATTAVAELRERQLNPLVARAYVALDQAERMLERAKVAEEDVRRTVSDVQARASTVVARVRSGLWPVIGLGRGVRAAVAAFTAPRSPREQRRADEAGESRFVYEGGTHVRN